MEGLVNYSSEDELDEQAYKSSAERGGGRSGSSGSHLRRISANYDNDGKRRRGGGDSGYGQHHAASSTSGGRNYKEEEKFMTPSTGYNSNRSSSQVHYNRDSSREQRDSRGEQRDSRVDSRDGRCESRDGRDNRDARDYRDYKDTATRDNRDYSNKSDYKNDRLNRSKEYNSRDQRRDDNFHDNRRPRNDDRNQRGGNGNSNSRSYHKDYRYNNNNSRHSESSNPRRYQNSRDDRADCRSERYGSGRKQRSPGSHSPSPTSSSNHSKRYSSHNDEHRTRTRGRNSRSRSRSHSPQSQKRSSPLRPSTKPMDQARSTASDLERKLNTSEFKTERDSSRQASLRHTEAVLTLPLSETAIKPPTVIAVTPVTNSGSSEPAVIQLPSYYNPSVINPNKYAEQVQKRKLIWGAKKKEDTSAKWGHAQFSQDSDGKVASKFMRLMGIKSGAAAEPEKQPVVDVSSREKMFTSMEKQYEVARQVTHTMRGVGLGFSSQTRPF